MSHHWYQCREYPEFSFNVPTLPETVQGTKFPSGVVHFHNGFLITENLRLNGTPPWVTEKQAELIHAWIKENKQMGWFRFIEEVDPHDKSRPCPYCFKRFQKAAELAKHLPQCEAAAPLAGVAPPEPQPEGKTHLGVTGVR